VEGLKTDALIIRALLQGDADRAELVRRTGIPRTTIYDHLVRLIRSRIVGKRREHDGNRRGRPRVIFYLKRLPLEAMVGGRER